jgi:hypothetical protein
MPENNSITSRYYPSLRDLVDKKKVPAFLHVFLFGDSTATPAKIGALEKIHYRNLQFTKSSTGDSASYSLDLVSKEEIKYELPGGLTFILNEGGNTDISAFPITLQYQWAILGFIRDLDTEDVSFTDIADLVEKAAQVFHLTGEELLANAFNLYVEPDSTYTDKFSKCVADINAKYSGASLSISSDSLEELKEATVANTAIQAANQTEFGAAGLPLVLFKVYIQDSDADIQKANFRKFFRIIAPNGIESYLKDEYSSIDIQRVKPASLNTTGDDLREALYY